MKRYSIYFLFSLCIAVSYVALDLQFGYRLWKQQYQQDFAKKVDHLEDEAFLAKAYLKATDSTERLYELLANRMKARTIDFWALYHRGTLHKTNLEDREISALNIGAAELQQSNVIHTLNGVNHSYIVYDIGDNFALVLGKTYALDRFLREEATVRSEVILKDMILVCLAAIGIFIFFFRDIMSSIRFMSGRSGPLEHRNYAGIHARSREAELILKGLSAYEDHATKIALEKDILSWQVLPSLRTEMMSGKAPPYDFQCTLVRTDINNFSKIYNEFPVNEFTSTINDFFTDATHVVSRYGGLVHEFIGDEVIYYFKDEDVGNSVAMALSAIRDINEIAEQYNGRMLAERGYPFTVKSSLAKGSLQFRRFVNGFNLTGAALIETVRILSHIHEKDENVVVFEKRHLDGVQGKLLAAPYATVNLKGYRGEQELFSYEKHVAVTEVLNRVASAEHASVQDLDSLRLYRSDGDIVAVLQWLAMRSLRGQADLALKVLSVLRSIHVTKADFAVSITLAEWLESLITRSAKLRDPELESHEQLLAAALRLIENLVPKAQFDERLKGICRHASTTKNRRVVANSLDVLTVMMSSGNSAGDFSGDHEFSRQLLEHEDNRVVANALIHEGSRGVSPLVVKRLRKMLSMRDEKFVASALYALGEISAHHKSRDPVYYQTQVDLLAMSGAIPVYVAHASAMVRKQALLAAKKIGDSTVLSRIQELVNESGSPDLAREVTQHLGENNVSEAKTRRSA